MTKCVWKLWHTSKVDFIYGTSSSPKCTFCKIHEEDCTYVLRCTFRQNFLFEKLLNLWDTFIKKGASQFMVTHIMANLYRWIQNEAPFIPNTTTSIHEELVKKAINDQNEIGWHQFFWGLHSKFWNTAHTQWIIQSNQQNVTNIWNTFSIKHIINLSIGVWAERCIQISKKRVSAKYDALLTEAKIVLLSVLLERGKVFQILLFRDSWENSTFFNKKFYVTV